MAQKQASPMLQIPNRGPAASLPLWGSCEKNFPRSQCPLATCDLRKRLRPSRTASESDLGLALLLCVLPVTL